MTEATIRISLGYIILMPQAASGRPTLTNPNSRDSPPPIRPTRLKPRNVSTTKGSRPFPESRKTPYSAPALAARARDLRRLATHFDPLPGFYGFEPNNEPGLGVKPDTMFGYNDQTLGDFRAWLQQRHGDLAKLNAALQTTYASLADITPPSAEEMAQIGMDAPRRALWTEWIEFRFQLMEGLHRSDWEALRSVSRKPIFDRTAGDGLNWCGVPASGALDAARQDRRARWHDALGTHVISPFLLDYQVGMSRGKRLVQSEYYWSTYGGGSDGLRYRFGGNFMHPILQNEARNFAAVSRNLWKAVSRGNDLFTVYFANPVNTYSFDEGYWGPHTAYWADHSFKAMTYAMKVVPREINRFRGEIIGARHVPQVGLVEPLASIVHTIGTPIAADIRDPQYEAENLHKLLLSRHVQTEIVGEWRLLEGPPPATPPGQSVSAMPLDLPPVLVAPYGVFLNRETQDRLAAWVGRGGTLLATGPVGLYDEYGRSCGKLLQAAFPGLTAQRGDGATVALAGGGPTVRRRWTFGAVASERSYADGQGAVLRGRLGKGEIIVTGFSHLDGPDVVADLLGQAVARHAPPLAEADNPSVQLYLCRREGTYLLYVVNEDHAQGQRTRLTLRRPLIVADLRSRLSLGTRTELTLNLRPGEGRVLRLTPR